MKGFLFLGDRQVKVREFPLPAPSAGEVRVAMRAAGLCGSDLAYLYRPSKEERKKPRYGMQPSLTIIPGHEPCGVVDEVGEGVTTLQVGDRVVVHQIYGCGLCKYCREGWTIHCAHKKSHGFDANGAFADFMIAKERNCVVLPPELSFADGAYCACGAGTVYKALNRLGISGTDTLVVFGLGPVGLAAVFFGSLMANCVIGVDTVDYRLKLASKTGARHILNGDKDNVVEAIMDITKGVGADAAIDCSGSPLARNHALDCTRIWGKVVFVGEKNKTTIDPTLQIIHKQLTLIGSWVFSIPDLQELVDFMVRNQLSLNPLITHRFTLDDAPEALEIFDKGHTGKVIFEWK